MELEALPVKNEKEPAYFSAAVIRKEHGKGLLSPLVQGNFPGSCRYQLFWNKADG